MQESTSLLATHLGIRIAKHKPDCGEEVAFPRAIATHNDIVLRRKGFDNGLFLVAVRNSGRRLPALGRDIPFKALNNDLLDVHSGLTACWL